jgi:glycogen(starch) synthase
MRILMLGWEFPPFMAGGLGTAVEGLTRSLVNQGHEVVFVVPQPVPEGHKSHVELLGPSALARRARSLRSGSKTTRFTTTTVSSTEQRTETVQIDEQLIETMTRRIEHFVPSAPSSYPGVDAGNALGKVIEHINELRHTSTSSTISETQSAERFTTLITASADQIADAFDSVYEDAQYLGSCNSGYGSDLFGDAQRYAQLVAALGMTERFDVIHAHDWLAYPAGLLLKQVTGKPLVCHIHATEFDRSGENINQGVYEIERAGMNGADRVIAVSRLTKAIVHAKYGVPEDRVDVVYNGVAQHEVQPQSGAAIEKGEKIVLFLGRITMQKGPEYFIEAAKRVLEKEEKVKFVVAGSGDMAVRMIEHAASIGIGHKVLFTGFLRGRDVDRVYQMADCYVMPSVSEPFGIAPLEAMRNDVPVIVSKQSGVSEVLTHALKVDFWDTDEMANKIVAVMRYPPLGQTLREHGRFELRGLNWDGAAEKCVKVYGRSIAGAT